MKRQPVESSVAKSVGYRPDDLTLVVEFVSGAIWLYAPVDSTVFERMINPSISAGSVLNVDVMRAPGVVGTKAEACEICGDPCAEWSGVTDKLKKCHWACEHPDLVQEAEEEARHDLV